jgi:acyl-CoA synthetase (AMP-forming)/AMP-acid ligase II
LIQRMLDRLTLDRVIQAYGMTECGTATYTLSTDSAEVVATTVGVACTDLELRIVDENNQPVATREAGEIVVRGNAVMDRYLDDDSATAATIDSEGWLHTGDEGMCNADGYYKILGRIKEMIIVGGFNVYPAEVEDMMREHSDIEDAAIIVVPDARLGEVVCAFIVARVLIEPDGFVAWCRERMANFKVPRYVETLEAFPLTGSNKVSKVDLHEMAASRKIGDSNVT